jgi:Icc-related predicted phosphoesterase
MFSRKSINKEPGVEADNEIISLNLSGNEIVFSDGGNWIVQSSDLDKAANEIDLIIQERDELVLSLKEATSHTEALNNEIIETNEIKSIALGMVRIKICV